MKKICSIIVLILCAATLFAGLVPRLWPPLLKKAAKKGGAEPSWTPPQQDELVVASIFDDGVFFDLSKWFVTNAAFSGSVTWRAPLFVWSDSADHSTNLSGNVAGYTADNSYEFRMNAKQSAAIDPPFALTNWTFSAWLKPMTQVDKDRWVVIAETASGYPDFWLDYRVAGSRVWFNSLYTTISDVTTDEWHHYCATYDYAAGKGTLYIDGSSNATVSTSYVIGNPFIYLFTTYRSSPAYYDDLYLWQTNLSPTEIDSIYNHGAPNTRTE